MLSINKHIIILAVEYMPSRREIDEEQKNLNRLRFLVDFTAAMLRQGDLTMPEMLQMIKAARKNVLSLFPDKGDTYDLIIKPRFERIIKERLEKN